MTAVSHDTLYQIRQMITDIRSTFGFQCESVRKRLGGFAPEVSRLTGPTEYALWSRVQKNPSGRQF